MPPTFLITALGSLLSAPLCAPRAPHSACRVAAAAARRNRLQGKPSVAPCPLYRVALCPLYCVAPRPLYCVTVCPLYLPMGRALSGRAGAANDTITVGFVVHGCALDSLLSSARGGRRSCCPQPCCRCRCSRFTSPWRTVDGSSVVPDPTDRVVIRFVVSQDINTETTDFSGLSRTTASVTGRNQSITSSVSM